MYVGAKTYLCNDFAKKNVVFVLFQEFSLQNFSFFQYQNNVGANS